MWNKCFKRMTFVRVHEGIIIIATPEEKNMHEDLKD
jgi:hypothetical protein